MLSPLCSIKTYVTWGRCRILSIRRRARRMIMKMARGRHDDRFRCQSTTTTLLEMHGLPKYNNAAVLSASALWIVTLENTDLWNYLQITALSSPVGLYLTVCVFNSRTLVTAHASDMRRRYWRAADRHNNTRPAGRMRSVESQDAARGHLVKCVNFGTKVAFVCW